MDLDITVTIWNQLVLTLASVSLDISDIQMGVASGSMIIITAERSMKNHKLLSLNAMKELVLNSLEWDRFGWFIREIGPPTHFLSR